MMIIGIPREIMPEENRVAAIPETVKKFIGLGYEVHVEHNAGWGSYYRDRDYAEAGAKIEEDVQDLYAKADLILKVKEPMLNASVGKHEIDMIKPGATLITFLHPAAPGNHEMIKNLRDKNITAFTMDGIPRISRAQKMDALTSMSTITGYKSVLIAASHLAVMLPMVGTAIGPLKPANFLVIGAGVVGLQAIATAKRLGAVVRLIDIQSKAREAAMSLGAKVEGFEVPDEIALGKGGYAKALPPDWLRKEQELISPILKETDAVILSALVPGEVAPRLITNEMLSSMKPGSVIIDVSIDQGGNCSETVPGEKTISKDVLISGIKNIPGSVPVHSTWLYANNIFYFVENLYKGGTVTFDTQDEIVSSSLVTHNREILHEGALKAMTQN